MASSDDFREQLKAGNITEALTLALSKAVELKITTWVPSAEDVVETTETKPGHRLRTRINAIEGRVENEIGDQFIGNGRYRELRQFHFEQAAQSNKIIQNNLKSLQKLFEVLIAMGYQGTATPIIDPESPDVESQLLPPAQEITDATIVTEPELVAEDSVLSSSSLTEEVIQDPQPLPEGLISSVTAPSDRKEELDEDTDETDDDDWDDSVLDLLESLPVGTPHQPEALDSDPDEDWRNFIDEEQSPNPLGLDSPENQDWGMLTREDFDPSPTTAKPDIDQLNSQSAEDLADFVEEVEPESGASDPLVDQNWEKLTFEDFQSPPTSVESTIESLTVQDDEDWGDLVEDEHSPEPENQVPRMESLDLEEDDEWDDWVVEESEPLQELPVTDMESLVLEEDDDWDDFEEDSDPFAPAPTDSESASELENDEDWDNFAADELEPYTPLMDVDINVGESFDSSDVFEDLTAAESAGKQTGNLDLNETRQASSSAENELDGFSQQQPERTNPSQQAARSSLEVLFADEPQTTQPHPVIPDGKSVESREEARLAEMQFEDYTAEEDHSLTSEESAGEREAYNKESERLAVSEEDLEPHSHSSEKRVPPPPPPPPPPSRFPNQNN
jgi:hypothetical protein